MIATAINFTPRLFELNGLSTSAPILSGTRNGLGADDLAAFANSRAIHRHFKPGQSLVTQGESSDHVYILLEGWVICQKLHEDGSRQILDLVMPGSILGYNCAHGTVYGFEAKTSCRVIAIARDAFSDLLLHSPQLCLRCAEVFSAAEARAFLRMSHLGRMTAKERVAGLIVELALRHQACGRDPGIDEIELPLTQQDIADMLGLAHETVCRVLVNFRTCRLTTWRSGKLEIHDVKRLIAIAGCDDEAEACVLLAGGIPAPKAHHLAHAA